MTSSGYVSAHRFPEPSLGFQLIFQVFATPVMVTVAKGLDAPIKLLAPRPSTGTVTDFAMLGLGDVVVPGLMVALCLRFDLAQYARRHPGKDVGPRSSFSRPYFWTGVVSYLLGLAITMSVMTYFKRAQPALLYLSPACSKSSHLCYHRTGIAS